MLYESYFGIDGLGVLLRHHGIKGQKWGIRRFQNPDGTLTPEGKKRYGTLENFNNRNKNLNNFYKNLKADEVAKQQLATLGVASTVEKEDRELAYQYFQYGMAVVTKFKKNKKENAIDMYIRGLKDPVMRLTTKNGEDLAYEFFDEHGQENFNAFMAYSESRNKR